MLQEKEEGTGMEIVIRGNSMVRGMRIEGVRVISEPGLKLEEMMNRAERERRGTVTIFVFGVPDLMRRGERHRYDQEGKERLVETIKRARGRREWELATVFPPKDSSWSVIMAFRDINALITTINGNFLGSNSVSSIIGWPVVGS